VSSGDAKDLHDWVMNKGVWEVFVGKASDNIRLRGNFTVQ
jgi:hypothetical protein